MIFDQGIDCGFWFFHKGEDKSQIKIQVWERGVDFSGQFIMHPRQTEVIYFEIQVTQIVMRFEMSWVVLQ